MILTRRVGALISAAAAVAAVLSACGSGGSDGASDQAKARTLNAEFSTNPTTFDPASAHAGDDFSADYLLYSSLLSRDDGGQLTGYLASKWNAVSPSKYVFTIRKDATCADGAAITPTVVANSLNYLADSTAGSHPFAPLVFGPGTPTITADDQASTVTIQTAAPYSNLLAAVAIPQSGIICPAGLADPAGLKAGTVKGAFSGPYTLAEATPGVDFTFALRNDFKAWPSYAKPLAGVPAPKIAFGIQTDPATTANKVISGDLDVAGLGGETLDRFKGDTYNKVQAVIANVYVMFNERPGHPFAGNPAARKAVAQAIDRKAFNTIFSNGVSPLFNSIVPDSYACVNKDSSLIEKHDPAAAGKSLAGLNMKFTASTAFGDQGRGAEYIQQVLTDAGAKVNLNKTDNATWASTTQNPNGDWDMTIMGDVNALNVISASLDRVMGTPIEAGGRNIGAVDNTEGAAALVAGLATVDQTEQCKQYSISQTTMLQRDDVVPLAGIVFTYVSPQDVVMRTPVGAPNYTTLRIVG